jgi:hypothetical protein
MKSSRFHGSLRLAVVALGLVTGDGLMAAPSTPAYPPDLDEAAVREAVSQANLGRPRLLLGPQQVQSLRERSATRPLLRSIARSIREDAGAMLDVPPIERRLEGRRLLGESRRAVRRVLTLSMAALLTEEPVYVERAALEMQAAAAFADWNPAHFLDVAEMTFALAVGYDWLYAHLDDATRAVVRSAILEKGVRVPLDTGHHGWTRSRNNWGQVCHAGLVAGALAVLEDDPEAAIRTVHRALSNVTVSMAMYDPKGSYPEGPGYWSYGTTYNVLLIAILESVLGSSFGLDRAPGFDQTGAYPALMTGPSGLYFNYADGGAGRGCEPALYWFAARYGRPDWLLGEERPRTRALEARAEGVSAANRFLPLLLLWLEDPPAEAPVRLPLHWSSECAVPVTLHRSSWDDANAVFVGFKAGSPSGPHGHMDTGSFALDADGVRWAVDLGAEGYHRIESRGMNFWSMAQNSDRWRVFRQNNHSHNTLVIDDGLQVAAGHAPIVRFSDHPDFPHSVADLSSVYAGQAGSVHRGIALLPDGNVLVRDRLRDLKPASRIRWGMVTRAAPADPGGRSIQLRQSGASLTLTVLDPVGSAWALYDTATPKNEWDSPNPGTVMVGFEFTAPASGALDLAVLITPGSRQPTPEDRLPLDPPLEWGR